MMTADVFVLFIIYMISFIIRVWDISYPNYVVFDEYHFGQFINCYHDSEFFFDIHPPFGKLLFYLFSKMIFYDGSLNFSDLENPYNHSVYVFFRLIPVILSSFVPVFAYSILRNSRISLFDSAVSATFAIFETSMISQSRFVLIEPILHFFVSLHLLILAIIKDFYSISSTFLIGISLGLGISIKMTSFSLIPFTILFIIMKELKPSQNYEILNILKLFSNICIMIFISVFVYFMSFCIHFLLLERSSRDAVDFLPNDISRYLFNTTFDKLSIIDNLCRISKLFVISIRMNYIMFQTNQKITQFHPYSSNPSTWPLLTGIWVGMWSNDETMQQINCFGNLFVYLFTSLALIYRMSRICMHSDITIPSISIIGWCLSYFPFYFVTRTTFLYHYQIALFFAILNFGFVSSFNKFVSYWSRVGAILSIGGFVYWRALLYGFPLSQYDMQKKVWNSQWRYGSLRHQKLVESFFDDFSF